jgi:hypothetical protein
VGDLSYLSTEVEPSYVSNHADLSRLFHVRIVLLICADYPHLCFDAAGIETRRLHVTGVQRGTVLRVF